MQRPGGSLIKTITCDPDYEPKATEVHPLPYPGIERLTGKAKVWWTQKCMYASHPELQVEAAATFLSPEDLEKFKNRTYRGHSSIAETFIPEEKAAYPWQWGVVVGELSELDRFKAAYKSWIAGFPAVDPDRCWPDRFTDSEPCITTMMTSFGF